MRLAIQTPPEHSDFGALRAVWQAADDLGFDAAFTFDHFLPLNPAPPGASLPGGQLEGWVSLATLAAATRRIRVGTLASGVTYRHPSLLAKMAVTLDHATGGRTVLGLGAGWHEAEHRMFGVEFPGVGSRMGRLDEALEICTLLFEGTGPIDFEGRHYRLRQAVFEPKPVRPEGIPLLVGGSGDRLRSIVARRATIYNSFFPPWEWPEVNADLDRRLVEAGRRPQDVERTAFVFAELSRDLARERALLEHFQRTRGGTDDEVRSRVVLGDPDRARAVLDSYAAAGIGVAVLNLRPPHDPAGLAWLAGEVYAPRGGRMTAVDLLVRGGVVLTMDPDGTELEGDVAVVDGAISAIGPNLDVEAAHTIEARGGAVLPGFVNAHMHECLERGWFEDLPFMRWLEDYALPKDRAYEPRHLHAAALLNQLEMIRGGTTSFVDIFRFPHEAAAVAERSGLRATFSPQVIDDPPGVGESFEDNLRFVEDWHDRVPDRIRTWFGPHALYSCTEETYARVREEADRFGVGIHTHLAESRDEVAIVAERTAGLSPAEYLDRLIGLGPDVACAHCIQLTDSDVRLIADRGLGVAHCPTSNMKLGNGVARVLDLRAAGATVGLGTDSVMTNNNLDVFEEMRQAALLQKLATRDATVLPCRDVLRMATIDSARVLGLADRVGSLEVGKRADLIVVGLDHAHTWPVFRDGGGNVAEQIVYACSAADVRTTVVDGTVLMEDGVVRSLDEREVEEVVHREARDLLEKAGVADAVVGTTARKGI